jgi:hypothetical protein
MKDYSTTGNLGKHNRSAVKLGLGGIGREWLKTQEKDVCLGLRGESP